MPLPFVHMEAPIYLRGQARKGPTFREAVLMHAVARLVLDPVIANIQASWVKMGPDGAALCLEAGCNDMGGVLMDESITRAAGAVHGQQLHAADMERLIPPPAASRASAPRSMRLRPKVVRRRPPRRLGRAMDRGFAAIGYRVAPPAGPGRRDSGWLMSAALAYSGPSR